MIHSHYLSYLDAYTAEPDVHEQRKVTFLSSEMVFPLLICGGGGVLDTVLVWFAISGVVSVGVAFAAHVALVATAWVVVLAKAKLGMETRVLKLLLLLLAATGPFGGFGGVVTLFAHLYQRNVTFSFQQWFDHIYPRSNLALGEVLYDGIMLGSDEHARLYDVVPYMDIMRLGTDFQKREAINQMTMHFQPQFTPAIQLALQDESPVVRTLAAISVSKIQGYFVVAENKLKKVLAQHENRPEYLLAMGKFCDDFAFCGLLDNQRREEYLGQAYDYYQRYLHRKNTDARAIGWVGRLLIKSNQYERAAEWLKGALDGGHTDTIIIGWYAEVLYVQEHYNELRQLMRLYGQRLRMAGDGALADAVAFWQRQGAAA